MSKNTKRTQADQTDERIETTFLGEPFDHVEDRVHRMTGDVMFVLREAAESIDRWLDDAPLEGELPKKLVRNTYLVEILRHEVNRWYCSSCDNPTDSIGDNFAMTDTIASLPKIAN